MGVVNRIGGTTDTDFLFYFFKKHKELCFSTMVSDRFMYVTAQCFAKCLLSLLLLFAFLFCSENGKSHFKLNEIMMILDSKTVGVKLLWEYIPWKVKVI